MRINSGKVRKNLGRIWTTPKRIFEAFLHSTNTKMHRHECNTHIEPIYLIQEIKQRFFSYNIFPVKKKCWKNFKILGKLLFNYSFYPHPEIGKFQGVTSSHNIACFRAQNFLRTKPTLQVGITPPQACPHVCGRPKTHERRAACSTL
jgi:hypothetical protein